MHFAPSSFKKSVYVHSKKRFLRPDAIPTTFSVASFKENLKIQSETIEDKLSSINKSGNETCSIDNFLDKDDSTQENEENMEINFDSDDRMLNGQENISNNVQEKR